MAGCLSHSEKGNVSLDDVKEWTKNLSKVLQNSRGRDEFKSFLTDKKFTEGQSLVEFWEMCDRFLIKAREQHQDTHRWKKENLELEACCSKTGGADSVDQSAKLFWEKAEEIVQFAEDNIDFDAEIKSLKKALSSEDTKKMETVISDAQQSAAHKLEGFYKAFCEHLLQEKGLQRKGD